MPLEPLIKMVCWTKFCSFSHFFAATTVSKEIASDPEYVARLTQLGIDDVLHWQKMSRAELKKFHSDEVNRWGAIVKLAGASAD